MRFDKQWARILSTHQKFLLRNYPKSMTLMLQNFRSLDVATRQLTAKLKYARSR